VLQPVRNSDTAGAYWAELDLVAMIAAALVDFPQVSLLVSTFSKTLVAEISALSFATRRNTKE